MNTYGYIQLYIIASSFVYSFFLFLAGIPTIIPLDSIIHHLCLSVYMFARARARVCVCDKSKSAMGYIFIPSALFHILLSVKRECTNIKFSSFHQASSLRRYDVHTLLVSLCFLCVKYVYVNKEKIKMNGTSTLFGLFLFFLLLLI